MVDKEVYELGKIVNAVSPSLGRFVCIGPEDDIGIESIDNKITEINYTGPPGTGSGIFYSLFFQLPKWDWHLEKLDEWIEVTPTHKEYYDRTMATKQTLEATIKTGLASAAQAVADFELLNHDLRKYKEILGYFHQKDEHSLKTIFIDQVDIHTGPLSIGEMTRNKWPTMTADFHEIKDDYMEVKKIKDKLKISQAEAIILRTKNKLYVDWKREFGSALKDRYERLKSLVLSRERSVKEYKEWLKPYISRFKTTKLGSSRPGVRSALSKQYLDVTGLSTFLNNVRMHAWKPLLTREHRRPSEEVVGEFKVHPYDDFVRNNLVLGGEFATWKPKYKALADIYVWLRNAMKYCRDCHQKGKQAFFSTGYEQCPECGNLDLEMKTYADRLVYEQIIPNWGKFKGTDKMELYYMLADISVDRLGIRLPNGELEDITFTIKMFTVSQNVLLVKILELICRDIELENYIEEMLGFKGSDEALGESLHKDFPDFFGKKKEQTTSGMKKFSKELKEGVRNYTGFFKKIKLPDTSGLGLSFMKPGNYETELGDRLKKHYLTVAGSNFGQIADLIKTKMGMV